MLISFCLSSWLFWILLFDLLSFIRNIWVCWGCLATLLISYFSRYFCSSFPPEINLGFNVNIILLLGLELSVVFRVLTYAFVCGLLAALGVMDWWTNFYRVLLLLKKTGSRLLRVFSLLFLSWGYACLSWPCGESRRQFWAGSLLKKKNGPLLPPCLFVFSTKPYSTAITQYNWFLL